MGCGCFKAKKIIVVNSTHHEKSDLIQNEALQNHLDNNAVPSIRHQADDIQNNEAERSNNIADQNQGNSPRMGNEVPVQNEMNSARENEEVNLISYNSPNINPQMRNENEVGNNIRQQARVRNTSQNQIPK